MRIILLLMAVVLSTVFLFIFFKGMYSATKKHLYFKNIKTSRKQVWDEYFKKDKEEK